MQMKHIPRRFWKKFSKTRIFNYLPDKWAVSIKYRNHFYKKLDLKNPRTFNEKLQWLKLYDRKPEYTTMVDKYRAKEYVASIIGDEYIIPTLGVWKSFDEIDFDALPNQFVLKCNHGSGDVVICKDKASLDVEAARKKLTAALQQDYYLVSREWPYRDVPRRIIAEEYLEDSETGDARDYKFFCFNGYVDCVMLCIDRNLGKPKFYFFDDQWKLKRLNKRGKEAPEGFTLPRPKCIEEMFNIASILSKGFSFLRVDLYECDGHVYFGELTFFPSSGFDANLLEETDLYFGSLIDTSLAKGE